MLGNVELDSRTQILAHLASGTRKVKSGRLTSDWHRSTILTRTLRAGYVLRSSVLWYVCKSFKHNLIHGFNFQLFYPSFRTCSRKSTKPTSSFVQSLHDSWTAPIQKTSSSSSKLRASSSTDTNKVHRWNPFLLLFFPPFVFHPVSKKPVDAHSA